MGGGCSKGHGTGGLPPTSAGPGRPPATGPGWAPGGGGHGDGADGDALISKHAWGSPGGKDHGDGDGVTVRGAGGCLASQSGSGKWVDGVIRLATWSCGKSVAVVWLPRAPPSERTRH